VRIQNGKIIHRRRVIAVVELSREARAFLALSLSLMACGILFFVALVPRTFSLADPLQAG